MRQEWLKGSVNIDEVDAWYAASARESGLAFETIALHWLALKAQLEPGDEIPFYRSDAESWRHLAGREGYALIRKGEIVDSIVTMMN